MINWLLFITLAMLTFAAYRIEKKCLIAPPVVISGVFSASSLLLAFNTNYWNYVLSFDTYLIIVAVVVTFGVGYYFFSSILVDKGIGKLQRLSDCHLCYPSKKVYFITALYGLITFVLFFMQQRGNANSVGMGSTLADIIQANRYHMEGAAHDSSIVRMLFVSFKAITYCFVCIYFYNRLIKGKRKNGFLTALISLIYLSCCVLTTSRSDVLYFAISTLFIVNYLFFYKNTIQNNKKGVLKNVWITIIIAILAIVAFRYLGTLTGKTEMYSTYDNISIYLSGSLVCFDRYITGAASNISSTYSPQLFSGVYSFLNNLGLNIPVNSYLLPHQYWDNAACNVYTSIFPYVVEFGLFGTLIIELALGSIFGVIWSGMKQGRTSWKSVFLYGNFFYVFVYYSIAERFFSQIFTLTSAVEIFVITIIIGLFLRTNEIAINNQSWERKATNVG